MWTPYQIEIILHHHTSVGRFPRFDAPIYGETINALHDLEVLCYENGVSRTTPRGKALVEMWTSTPLPKQAWIDPRTGERINHDEIG
ncbi:hypothetical protein [Agrobacterium rubi]|uniref:hypothetical protein n=1 Tax=Agrobacterium rubi TaxID=28099 RepID=UPI001572164A|nr:hypothetical protein [Agrobacterium rubi]NTE87254.1 hypothetical protein [Agrobacterium rubi]NTF03188.1 hypothetical protein [Agrobacterium rubi]